MKPRLLLIDADTFIYLSATINEVETQWDTWLWTLHADLDASIVHLDRSLKQLQADLKADRIILALTDEVNWRKDVLESYKANRLLTRKPICYQAMRQYVAEQYEVFQRPTLEGDDVLGILATAKKYADFDRIIISPDKDLRSIPGKLYRCREEEGKTPEDLIETITEAEADRYHLFQTLTGDRTDNYPGCPGVGPVRANKLLDEDCSWATVVAAYEKQGLSEEVALTNAQVARICRVSEYDFKEGRVRLWRP